MKTWGYNYSIGPSSWWEGIDWLFCHFIIISSSESWLDFFLIRNRIIEIHFIPAITKVDFNFLPVITLVHCWWHKISPLSHPGIPSTSQPMEVFASFAQIANETGDIFFSWIFHEIHDFIHSSSETSPAGNEVEMLHWTLSPDMPYL